MITNRLIKITIMLLISSFMIFSCDDENKCLDSMGFAKVTCENDNEVCVPETGKCEDLCKDTKCEEGIQCNKNSGECDKCLTITCEKNEVCDDGNCIDKCKDISCDTGLSCDKFTGNCIDKCKGVSCDNGKSCDRETGECK